MNNTNLYRVRASVYPTTEILKFLCLKLLRVQGNRIIAERARDSSGRIPLYRYQINNNFINLSIMSFIQTLEIKKGAPFQYTNLSRTYPDEINNKGVYINLGV